MELIAPAGNYSFTLTDMRDMDGNPVKEALGSGYKVQIPLEAGDYELGLLASHIH